MHSTKFATFGHSHCMKKLQLHMSAYMQDEILCQPNTKRNTATLSATPRIKIRNSCLNILFNKHLC